MKVDPYLKVVGSIALLLSALTLPMTFIAKVAEISEHQLLFYQMIAIISPIWRPGLELTGDSTLLKPQALLLVHVINFCLFFIVLALPYFIGATIARLIKNRRA